MKLTIPIEWQQPEEKHFCCMCLKEITLGKDMCSDACVEEYISAMKSKTVLSTVRATMRDLQ